MLEKRPLTTQMYTHTFGDVTDEKESTILYFLLRQPNEIYS